MAVKLQGQHRFEAARDRVWAALLDPAVLTNTLPGCEQLEQIGDNQFKGALTIKVGPVQGSFNGTLTLSDLVPPESYRLVLDGQGPSGFMNGSGTLRLEEVEENGAPGTLLHYDIDAQVGGRIAGVGQRLLDSSAKVITRQALEGLGRQLATQAPEQAAEEGASESSAATAAQGPSQAEFAGEFAKGLAGELIPPERRRVVGLVGIIVLAAIILLIIRGCG